jgi:AGZA family xanthine/uracil permease-like MFS transporter
MGLNAFFTFAVVLGMGKTWQFALTAVFLEGIIFILLTFLNVREAIINSIPANIKKAISVGIGLFIAFIGLSNSGIIVQGGGTILEMGNVLTPVALLTLLGVVIITVLLALNVKGALFIGIVATTLIGIPMGVTDVSNAGFFSKPPSLSPIMFQFEFDKIFTLDMFVVLLTFLFVDLFDTVGTLVGVCTKANMLDENGRVPKAKQALLADSIGTTVGAFLGTSTVTTYVESASGVTEGGRTGLTAVTTAIMFLLALILSPVFLMIPGAATAPALIIVGLFMMSPIKEIDFEDYTEALPAFITMLFMPLTYSIANGIFFGIISFVVLKLLTKKTKDVPLLTLVLAIMFVIKIVFKF